MLTSPDYFRSEVPAGRSGAWVIEKIMFPDRGADPAADLRPDCFKFRPGLHTILSCGSTQFMSDLYDEWWTQRIAVAEATARGGDILITGLGLGLVAEAMLRSDQCPIGRITIVELSADVIRLVAPFLQSRYPGKIEIVHGDAFAWEPPLGRHFSVGWHDIWPDPHASSNLGEMERLEGHHRSWCDWQGFWPREYLAAAAIG